MIINPQTAIERKIITNILNIYIQKGKNCIDLTLNTIAEIPTNNLCKLLINKTIIQKRYPMSLDPSIPITLYKGIYNITFNENIDIPNGICAKVYTKNELNKCGNFITTSLYNSGYQGIIGGILHVYTPIQIEWGIRLAKICFQESK